VPPPNSSAAGDRSSSIEPVSADRPNFLFNSVVAAQSLIKTSLKTAMKFNTVKRAQVEKEFIALC
jgi:hypothetical protein